MNLLELEENKLKEIKKELIEGGVIFEKNKITQYDDKFFETVKLSNSLIKYFLYFSLGVYIVINIIGTVMSIIYAQNYSLDIVGILAGLFAICFIVYAIFRNINTNKKKEEFPIFIKGENFIFNFSDGITETLNLFYALPYESVQKIEFIIHGINKRQLFGSVSFTFQVMDYTVNHSLRYTNLTAIEKALTAKFPTLLNKLIIDGKGNNEIIKRKQKLKTSIIALALLAVSVSLIIVPRLLDFNSAALIIAGVILITAAIHLFVSSYLYTYFLNQGMILACVFIIIGFCVPVLIVEISEISIINYIKQDPEILLATIFGIIGLCLYVYIGIVTVSKLNYILHKKYGK